MEYYDLSNSSIALAREQADRFLLSLDVERREALRILLTLEEVLLEYQAKFGIAAVCSLKCTKRFSAARIEIAVKGEACNPFEKEDSDVLISSLLAGIGLAPGWNYKNGTNYIVFTPKKRPVSQTFKMVSAIGLSFVVGFLMTLLPDAVQTGVSTLFLSPLTDLFMGLIFALSGPLVFLSVLGSICSMGSMETLGKFGKKTVLTFLTYSLFIGLILTAIETMFYQVTASGGTGFDLSQILFLVYDIVPSNLLEPFVSGNVLQIVFIAVLFGIAMLMLSAKVSGVFSIVEQLGFIVQTAMGILSGMLPVSVFLTFANMIVSGKFQEILGAYRMVLIMLLLMLIYFAGMLLWVSIRKKVPLPILIRKLLPTFTIALTTGSAAAAFSTNLADAKEKLGIEARLADFGVPLGQVLFKPYVFLTIGTLELAFAESYGMELSLSWLVLAFITNLLLSFALPPVPGASLMGFTIAFTQLGIPLDSIAVPIAICTIFGFPTTSMNQTGLQLVLIDIAEALKVLDKDTLRKEIP